MIWKCSTPWPPWYLHHKYQLPSCYACYTGCKGFSIPNARRVATMTWLRLCLSIPFCTLAVLVTWLLSKAWAKQAKQLCFHSKRCWWFDTSGRYLSLRLLLVYHYDLSEGEVWKTLWWNVTFISLDPFWQQDLSTTIPQSLHCKSQALRLQTPGASCGRGFGMSVTVNAHEGLLKHAGNDKASMLLRQDPCCRVWQGGPLMNAFDLNKISILLGC